MNLKKLLGIKEIKPVCVWKPISNYYKERKDTNHFYYRVVCESCTGEDLNKSCYYNPSLMKGGKM